MCRRVSRGLGPTETGRPERTCLSPSLTQCPPAGSHRRRTHRRASDHQSRGCSEDLRADTPLRRERRPQADPPALLRSPTVRIRSSSREATKVATPARGPFAGSPCQRLRHRAKKHTPNLWPGAPLTAARRLEAVVDGRSHRPRFRLTCLWVACSIYATRFDGHSAELPR